MKTPSPVTSGISPTEPQTHPEPNRDTGPTRILVVDDEPTIRLGVEYSLTTEGYEVETADDGDAAIERLLNQPEDRLPDAVVLDLRMPGADGMEVMRRVAREGRTVPVAIASAYIDSPTAIEAIELGVVDFLKKPITPDQVRGLVARMLSEEFRFGPVARSPLPKLNGDSSDPEAAIAAARCCLRRRRREEAIRLLEDEDPSKQSDAGLWLMIAKQLRASRDNPDAPGQLASASFYQAANLLDFLAFS